MRTFCKERECLNASVLPKYVSVHQRCRLPPSWVLFLPMVTATLLGLLTEQWGFSMSNSRSSFTLLEQTFGVPAKAPLTVLNRHSNKEDPNGGGVVHRLYPSGFRCQLPAYHAQTCLPTLEQIPLLPSTFNLSPLRYPRANLPKPAPGCHTLCT